MITEKFSDILEILSPETRASIYEERVSYNISMGDGWRNDFCTVEEGEQNDARRLEERVDNIFNLVNKEIEVDYGEITNEIEDWIKDY
jgi:hypothetical protein